MPSLLIIEDDFPLQKKLKQIFTSQGYEVYTANNGTEGLDAYRKNPSDVILTDIIMPEKDGLETLMELIKEFPNAKIIAMSGGGRDGYDGYLKLAEGLGAKKTFAKPFNLEELLAAASDLVEN